jgi:dihydropteroate synthase-like protein
MRERILFLTGKLAEAALRRVLEAMQPADFDWEIRNLGVSVAALMTADMVRRRLHDIGDATRIVFPGRCRGDFEALARDLGVPMVRGPEELKDLPELFGAKRSTPALDRHDCLIFAEVVDAPRLDVAQIVARAHRYREDGADVIDLGFLPATPFPHVGDAVRALKAEGFAVSVDSLDPDDLRRGCAAGADYVLSLTEATVDLVDEIEATPVLIPTPAADLESLDRLLAAVTRRGRRCFVDPILEPIHHGFTASIARYAEVRRRHPEVPILMGVGNLTELTEADTAGINAMLAGIVSELRIDAILATEVSPHARRAVAEADWARRLMFAARAAETIPKGFTRELVALHERRNPFPDTPGEIAELAATVRDPNFRIRISSDGVHVFNRAGMQVAVDPFDFFPGLAVEQDGAHAFYLGVELARAEIAWRLGKRYAQDQPLDWGCAVPRPVEDLTQATAPGTTLRGRKPRRPEPDDS